MRGGRGRHGWRTTVQVRLTRRQRKLSELLAPWNPHGRSWVEPSGQSTQRKPADAQICFGPRHYARACDACACRGVYVAINTSTNECHVVTERPTIGRHY